MSGEYIFCRCERYKDGRWCKFLSDPHLQTLHAKKMNKHDPQHRPGAGVYRSSRMNARRLAATETNMAYRTADHERWQQLDFVVGIRIECSALNHVVLDICDTLAGDYPKDFKWTGWHPHCRCHATSILKTDEELDRDAELMDAGEEPSSESVNAVTELPKDFTKWVEMNEGKILDPEKSTPYFLRDNWDDVRQILHIGTNPETPLETAAARHLLRTPIEEQSIRDAWAERNRDPRTIAANRHAARSDADAQAIRDAWDKRTTEYLNEELSKLPSYKWHDKIGGSYINQLEKLCDNYETLTGGNITSTQFYRDAIKPNGIYNDGSQWAKDKVKEAVQTMRTSIDNILQSDPNAKQFAQDIALLRNLDISKLPKGWRDELLPLAQSLNKAGFRSYSTTFLSSHQDALYAINIAKLATNADAKELGLQLLSTKTPATFFEYFVKHDKELLKALPNRTFFDGLSKFVPMHVDLSDNNAHCTREYPPSVHIGVGPRYKTVFGLKDVITHEYGHAYDRLSNRDYNLIWRNTDTQLRAEYDKLKSIVTTDEYYSGINSNYDKIRKAINDEYQKQMSLVQKEFSDQIDATRNRYGEYWYLDEQCNRELSKLGDWYNKRLEGFTARRLYKQNMLSEQYGTLNDIVEAMHPLHKNLGFEGHGAAYWGLSANRDLAEFIAECSERRWCGVGYLDALAPEISKLMKTFGGKFWH
ncbi:MAG: hypothetical protein LIP02_02800 [Bacteroidales bacterium]|nr:hypothetical protein [Bacteroidales bacterium]